MGLSTPTEHVLELFRLQQASPELPLHPLDGLRVLLRVFHLSTANHCLALPYGGTASAGPMYPPQR